VAAIDQKSPGSRDALMTELGDSFRRAVALHQRGQFADADRLYREILRQRPNHFDALHLLGVIALQTGRTERGVQLIGKAVRLNGNAPAAHNNLGNGLRDLKRLIEAVASYDKAITLKPDYAEAHYNRGNALRDLHRHDAAIASYDKAISLTPAHPDAHNNRGLALRALNLHAESVASFEKAIALKPGYAEAHTNRGTALHDLKRYEEAVASFDKAIALQPDFAEAHGNRGVSLQELRRPEEAIASLDKAIALQPDFAEAHGNRGNALRDLQRHVEAIASYDRAIAQRPDYVEAYSNRGAALQDMKRHDEAAASFDKAIALRPDYAEAYWNQSLCQLQMGHYERGWRLYEWRKKKEVPLGNRPLSQPLWLGEQDIAGKTLFLHWEQGFGDTIQFCRYAKLAEQHGARVIMEVQPPLRRLLPRLSPTIQVIDPSETPAGFDYHCPLLSLPLAFGTTLETIPSEPCYLRADTGLRALWSARLPPTTRPRAGIVWSGSSTNRNDHNRSISLEMLLPLIDCPAGWFCLQKEVRETDAELSRGISGFTLFRDALSDFSDTAALIDLMDLVITVDTSVAHLAAAMGKPVWILLPFNPDWRWLLNRDDSPWYPSVRLFRQQKSGDWAGVIDRVKTELNFLIEPS
jgi:tetratricopeptide (TPR) repeat protein